MVRTGTCLVYRAAASHLPSAMNSSISSLQMARTRGSSFFIASGVNGGHSHGLAGLCSGGSEVVRGPHAGSFWRESGTVTRLGHKTRIALGDSLTARYLVG